MADISARFSVRFPGGLTVWEANGQWRHPDGQVEHEAAKVVLLVP